MKDQPVQGAEGLGRPRVNHSTADGRTADHDAQPGRRYHHNVGQDADDRNPPEGERGEREGPECCRHRNGAHPEEGLDST